MKTLIAAIAMTIASPALAQADPHAAHAAHGAADHATHGQGSEPDKHDGHDEKDGCCHKMADGKMMPCCEKMKADGKKIECCDKQADAHAGHDMSKH